MQGCGALAVGGVCGSVHGRFCRSSAANGSTSCRCSVGGAFDCGWGSAVDWRIRAFLMRQQRMKKQTDKEKESVLFPIRFAISNH